MMAARSSDLTKPNDCSPLSHHFRAAMEVLKGKVRDLEARLAAATTSDARIGGGGGAGGGRAGGGAALPSPMHVVRHSSMRRTGAPVEANYKGKGKWYPGRIARVYPNGTCVDCADHGFIMPPAAPFLHYLLHL